MTINGLLSSRDTAGARYAAAVAELHAAPIALGGIDEALHNAAIGHDGRHSLKTFFNVPQTLGTLAREWSNSALSGARRAHVTGFRVLEHHGSLAISAPSLADTELGSNALISSFPLLKSEAWSGPSRK